MGYWPQPNMVRLVAAAERLYGDRDLVRMNANARVTSQTIAYIEGEAFKRSACRLDVSNCDPQRFFRKAAHVSSLFVGEALSADIGRPAPARRGWTRSERYSPEPAPRSDPCSRVNSGTGSVATSAVSFRLAARFHLSACGLGYAAPHGCPETHARHRLATDRACAVSVPTRCSPAAFD